MNEKVCRLCLQKINENCHQIGENVGKILKLNLSISKETVMCMECKDNFEVFHHLKSACVDMRESARLKNHVNLDSVNTENTNNQKSVEFRENGLTCSFCMNFTLKEQLASLHESKENMFLVDMLGKYIPELNLSTEELLTCETCLDKTRRVSSFLMKIVDVEEKITKYTDIEGMDDKVEVELRDVQLFTFNQALKFEPLNVLEQTCDQIQKEYNIKAEEAEVNYDQEVDNLELSIQTESVFIKLEQSDCDSFEQPSGSIKLDNDPLELPSCQTEMCPFETKHKQHFNQHKLANKSLSEIRVFKCKMCTFETKRKGGIKEHMVTHRNPSEIAMFKCDF